MLLDRSGTTDQTKEFLDEGYVDEGADDGPIGHSQIERGPNGSVPSPFFYGDGIDDDPLRSDEQMSPSPDDTTSTTAALNKLIQQAITHSLPPNLHGELEDVFVA